MMTYEEFKGCMYELGYKSAKKGGFEFESVFHRKNNGNIVVVNILENNAGFSIFGDIACRGTYVNSNVNTHSFGISISPNTLGLDNMLEVCANLCSGSVGAYRMNKQKRL